MSSPTRRTFLQTAVAAAASFLLPRGVRAGGNSRSFWFLHTPTGESWAVDDPVAWALESAREPILERARDRLLTLDADASRFRGASGGGGGSRSASRPARLSIWAQRPAQVRTCLGFSLDGCHPRPVNAYVQGTLAPTGRLVEHVWPRLRGGLAVAPGGGAAPGTRRVRLTGLLAAQRAALAGGARLRREGQPQVHRIPGLDSPAALAVDASDVQGAHGSPSPHEGHHAGLGGRPPNPRQAG